MGNHIDLTINNDSNSGLAEYASTIHLPEGCWISGYYLYVGDRKEEGILAEKKTAVWVFSQIRNENRDPGILYYLSGNKVAFRVFPFAAHETRRTGIEFLHKEPVKLTIGSNIAELGNAAETREENFEDENMLYVSAKQKQLLKPVQRKPYFHFLVDASDGKNKNAAGFTKRIEQLCEQYKPLAENAAISFVGSYVHSFPFNSQWKQHYTGQKFEGGFYLDRAVRTSLCNAYTKNSNTYPVLVVVTDSIRHAVTEKDFADLRITFPESDLFFELSSNATLIPHSLVSQSKERFADSTAYSFNNTVLSYPLKNNSVAYLPNNNEPSIILKKDIFEMPTAAIKEKNWASALLMQGKWTSQVLHPETSAKEWLNLVKYSFLTKVMTPVTSYLVVENEAQKAVLKKKQEQVLSANKSLDPGEDTERMSEPGILVLAVLLLAALWYRERRKRLMMK